MTLFFYPPTFRQMRRQMLSRMENDDWTRYERQVVFPVDIRAEDEDFVITALLPGVKAEDLNIQITNENIVLQGELKFEREENGTYLLSELPSGRFYRTLTLPDALNANGAEAELKDGVLTLRVPKAEEAKPKSIKINAK